MIPSSTTPRPRRIGRLILGILLLIWAASLQDAIMGGFLPGRVLHPFDRPYPVGNVLMTCVIITGELALLFATLRPFSITRRRVLIALAVFGPLWIGENVLVSGWSDQPSYCYSNGLFLGLTVFILVAAVAASLVKALIRK